MESGVGVKGLVDSGVTKLPRFFVRPLEQSPQPSVEEDIQFQVPVIDLNGIETGRRGEIVSQIRDASEKWGIFQLVNHGVPIPIMDKMLDGIRRFNEQPLEVKRDWLSEARRAQQVNLFHFNHLPLATWKDSLSYKFPDGKIDEEVIPQICREATSEYTKYVFQLKETLSELTSEALGLKSDYLEGLKCMKTAHVLCHYYPACPEPELTIGTNSHTDASFLTILLQDNTGGLQVLHQNQWLDLPCVPGSLVINYGDLMQLITNGKFKAARHRVVAKIIGPRISSAFFLFPAVAMQHELYGPLEELVSEENPPIYKPTSSSEYFAHFISRRDKSSNTSGLSKFMLSP
ncbi:hypothetical protein SLEP1_g38326 [Rubroshorea leprosula]|nr:hypothetical protein SLEP1_g38326 [Rubroshorea leprosula]